MPAAKNTNNTAAKKAAKFAQLRQKAINSGLATESKVSDEPYILGEDFGFDPEVRIEAPNLEKLLILQRAINGGDVLEQSTTLFGGPNTERIVRALDQQFDTAAASQILTGIILDVIEHFWGQGAAELGADFTD